MHAIEQRLLTLWNWLSPLTLHISIIIAMILLIRATIGLRMEARWRCALWGVVVLRLVLPSAPTSRWSVMSLLPATSKPPLVLTEEPATVVIYGPAPSSVL